MPPPVCFPPCPLGVFAFHVVLSSFLTHFRLSLLTAILFGPLDLTGRQADPLLVASWAAISADGSLTGTAGRAASRRFFSHDVQQLTHPYAQNRPQPIEQ